MKKIFLILCAILAIALVSAHTETSEKSIHWEDPIIYIKLSGSILVFFSVLFIFKKEFSEKEKKIYFTLMVAPVILSTLFLAGSTIYENITSITKGPVHWHADYQVWVCGERLDLVNPKFPRNKIGTPLFHEHDDDRIHIEGTVMQLEDVNLENYFRVIGGKLEQGYMAYPTTEGMVEVKDNDLCPDGTSGTLRVYINGQRFENYQEHILYPHAYVPPGDCIILVFDNSSEMNYICESWQVKDWNYDNFQRPQEQVGEKIWQ